MNYKERLQRYLLKNLPHLNQSSQQGGAVVTRNQAKKGEDIQNAAQSNPSVIISRKRKLQDIIPISKKKKIAVETNQQSQSPIPGSSRNFEDENQDYLRDDDDEGTLFDSVTKIYEDENLEVNVVKEMFRKQRIFRIQDHNFVMRIKSKNKQSEYPLLESLFNVLRIAFTFMINNLKIYLPPTDEEDNLVYLCIYQVKITYMFFSK